MISRFLTAAAGIAACACCASAQIEAVVPPEAAGVGGNSNNSFPFGTTTASQRYQQVYAASGFVGISGPHRITEIRFRPNQTSTFPAWSNQFTLDMRFSITQVGPDNMSTTFADNVGINEQVVYSGPAEISTQQTGPSPGGAAMEFDIVITLQNPYIYDPALGNLLIDIRRDGVTLTVSRFLDAASTTGDAVGRAWATGSTSLTGSTSTLGLITKFIMDTGSTGCYANCDGSTVEPILNIDDFTCFINEFAAGLALPPEQQVTHYANCDGSTVAPALNIDDFTCFINEYAQGCR